MVSSAPSYEIPVGNRDRTNAAVVIIGGGISGVCVAIDLILRQKIKNLIILEKSGGFGGTWRDNIYPGCGCDVWSHLYSFSFEQKADWTRQYSGQEEILTYLTGVAEKFGLYKHVRFNTEVEEARWNEDAMKWETTVRVKGGKDAEFGGAYTIKSDFLVSGVGQLNFPSYPNIPGINEFKGRLMHSARWDWNYNLKGKKVAVIGNGSTSVQIVPEVAKEAAEVTVFQRSPNWVIPKSDAPITGLRKQALKLAPIRSSYRAYLMDFREGLHGGVFDEASKVSIRIRGMTKTLMETQLSNKPELWSKLTPNFPPGCKRIIISDDYYPTLNRKNLRLETRPIDQFTPNGIQVDGKEEPFDLVILATGFRTLEFMYHIKITGRDNRSIQDIWRDGAQAFKGVAVECLPNFGMCYGPNSSVTHNSIILMIEAQSRYINAMMKPVLQARCHGETLSICPKKATMNAYNARIQEKLSGSAFAHPNCTSWFKNDKGKIINTWSGTVVEYQKELSNIYWADFDISGTAADSVRGEGCVQIRRVVEEMWVNYKTLALALLSAASIAGVLLYQIKDLLRVL